MARGYGLDGRVLIPAKARVFLSSIAFEQAVAH
jgi:hypothetical protein